MNDDSNSTIDVSDYLERISQLNTSRAHSISTQDEADVEQHAHISDIMKDIDSKASKQTEGSLKSSAYEEEIQKTVVGVNEPEQVTQSSEE